MLKVGDIIEVTEGARNSDIGKDGQEVVFALLKLAFGGDFPTQPPPKVGVFEVTAIGERKLLAMALMFPDTSSEHLEEMASGTKKRFGAGETYFDKPLVRVINTQVKKCQKPNCTTCMDPTTEKSISLDDTLIEVIGSRQGDKYIVNNEHLGNVLAFYRSINSLSEWIERMHV